MFAYQKHTSLPKAQHRNRTHVRIMSQLHLTHDSFSEMTDDALIDTTSDDDISDDDTSASEKSRYRMGARARARARARADYHDTISAVDSLDRRRLQWIANVARTAPMSPTIDDAINDTTTDAEELAEENPAQQPVDTTPAVDSLDGDVTESASRPSRGLPPRHTAPEVDPSTIDDGGGVTEEGVGKEAKRARKDVLEKREAKRARKAGAILAPSRTAEGYSLPTGNQKTCKPDALFNGLKTLGFDAPSLARLRSLSVPQLGLNPMASWASIASTLTILDYPFLIEEATWRFKGEGGPLLNLLRAPSGVFLVSLLVTVDGVRNKHCVMLSTLKERHAPFGKLIDNHGKMVPTYLEKKDVRGKEVAKAAWKLFIGQNPALNDRTFSVEPVDVYALVRV